MTHFEEAKDTNSLSYGVQEELWSASHNCSKCSQGQLEEWTTKLASYIVLHLLCGQQRSTSVTLFEGDLCNEV